MKGRIVIPIHDSSKPGSDPSNIQAYAGYSITKKQKEYGDWKFPDGFPKGSHLFNLNRVKEDKKQVRESLERHGLIVVESFWNVLKLYQAGIKNVVALMGTAMTAEQEKLLLESTDKVKLWLDSDDAGKKGLQNILRHPKDSGKNGLIYKAHIRIIDPAAKLFDSVEDRAKPYQFNEEEIKTILSWPRVSFF